MARSSMTAIQKLSPSEPHGHPFFDIAESLDSLSHTPRLKNVIRRE
jgi:hypothetical protein